MAELMTIEELEQYLRFTRKTIYKLLKEGNIPAIRIGNKWRFDKEVIDRWLHRNMEDVKARILVIDDEEIILSLFKEVLEEKGHAVMTADNSADGFEYVMRQHFDLIFLDLKMSGVDGADVLRAMRSLKPGLPVVIITGYHDSEVMERASKQGPLGVMLKPFTGSEILNAVNSFLHAT